jgi:fatty acid desaturase
MSAPEPRPPSALAELSRPRLHRWLLPALLDWAVLLGAFATAGVVDHAAVYVLASVVIGTRQHALALLGHDGAHRLVCRHPRLNDALASVLCFWPLGFGIAAYRNHHLTHHRHPGGPDDPELAYKRRAAPQWDLPARAGRLARLSALDLTGVWGARELLRVLSVTPPVTVLDVLGPVLWWGAVWAVVAVTGAWWVLVLWYASLVTVFWTLFRLRIWTEHMGTAGTHRVSATWWQRLTFLPHNTWCHYEHHRWVKIPFWNLPRARELDRAEPVVPVGRLVRSYATAGAVPSGEPLATDTRMDPKVG